MNKEELNKILNKFDKVLENYEIDKKIGQLSVDSVCHLFPTEIIAIKDYIKYLEQALLDIKEIFTNYEELEKVIGAGKPRFPLYKVQRIVNKAIGSKDE